MTDYLVYDVFTDRPFGGNQLAIVPNASELPEERLLTITREFDYSETVFLFPPEGDGMAKVRIFTPGGEVPFAGHPLIGTIAMLGEAGLGPDFVLELGIGDIPVRVVDGLASFVTTTPLTRIMEPSIDLVARALGCPEGVIVGQPVMAGVGLEFVFTELQTRAALSTLAPDAGAIREGDALHPTPLAFGQCAYVQDGRHIHMRVFAPGAGIPEDAATGSAAAGLAALLCEAEGAPIAGVIHQGVDMGRPSVIEIAAKPGEVTVAGRAVRVMEGTLLA